MLGQALLANWPRCISPPAGKLFRLHRHVVARGFILFQREDGYVPNSRPSVYMANEATIPKLVASSTFSELLLRSGTLFVHYEPIYANVLALEDLSPHRILN